MKKLITNSYDVNILRWNKHTHTHTQTTKYFYFLKNQILRERNKNERYKTWKKNFHHQGGEHYEFVKNYLIYILEKIYFFNLIIELKTETWFQKKPETMTYLIFKKILLFKKNVY